MSRKTFDLLLSAAGVMLMVVLVAAGILGLWAHNVTTSQVRQQLGEQKISFPAAGSPQLADPKIGPYISKYAGQQVLTGPQAKAFADHYILVHLQESKGATTYSEASAASRAKPDDAQLKAQVETMFRGTTLRGMLLNAYAFWTIGEVAQVAAIVSFTLAGVLAVLTVLGFVHYRRVAWDALFPAAHPRKAAPTAG